LPVSRKNAGLAGLLTCVYVTSRFLSYKEVQFNINSILITDLLNEDPNSIIYDLWSGRIRPFRVPERR
jgi:hypothetical protein